MPNIFHQSVEDILKAATPEQKIIWNDIFLRYGQTISVSQFFYKGLISASELSVYVARKMYLALQLSLPQTGFGAGASPSSVQLFDEGNISLGVYGFTAAYWDATAAAARFISTSSIYNNLVFSRLNGSGTSTIVQFVGYRITY